MSTVESELVQQDDMSNIFSSGVGSSIDITSEARDLSQINFSVVDEDDEDLYNESSEGGSAVLLLLREGLISGLQTCQGNIVPHQNVVTEIASIDEPLQDKCTTIAVVDILPRNHNLGDEGHFKVIASGVDILIKYSVNLLKEKKNPNWRSIKKSNGTFLKKVKPLEGHGDVLVALGYTQRNPTSFDFPKSCEKPDLKQVAVVTADLMVLHKELSQFCEQTHVNRDRFITNFSTLQAGDPKPEIIRPTDLDGIDLEKIQDVTGSPGILLPPDETASTSPTPPVPAPRRNLPKAISPETENASGFPQLSEVRVPLLMDYTPVQFPQIGNLHGPSTSPLNDEDDPEITPSVGAIKYPPGKVYIHDEDGSGISRLPPRWAADTQVKQLSRPEILTPVRKAPLPPNTNHNVKSDQLMKPADFVRNPGYPREMNLSQGGTVPMNTQGISQGPAVRMPPENHGRDFHGNNQVGVFGNTPHQTNNSQDTQEWMQSKDNSYYMNYSGSPPLPPKTHKRGDTMSPVGPPDPVYHHVPLGQKSPVQSSLLSEGERPIQLAPRFPQEIQHPGHNHGRKLPPGSKPAQFAPIFPPQMPSPPGLLPGSKPPVHFAPRFPPQMPSPEHDHLQQIPPGGQHPQFSGAPRFPPQNELSNYGHEQQVPPVVQPTPPQPGTRGDDRRLYESNSSVPGTDAQLTSDNIQNVSPSNSAGYVTLNEVQLEKCAMCEGKPGVIHCDKCQSARCESCDKRWHSHPKRKAHKTRRLVQYKEDPVEATVREKSHKDSPCFICGVKDINEIHCRTCSDFFCGECNHIFHNRPDRSNHDRETVQLVTRSPPVPELFNHGGNNNMGPAANYTDRGARPKISSGDVSTHNETPRKEQVSVTPSSELSETQILKNKWEDTMATDLQILEKIADVKFRGEQNQESDIEGQLIQEDKILQHQHQDMVDLMHQIQCKLSDLADEEKRHLYQKREPIMRDHRESQLPYQDHKFNTHSEPQNMPQAPRRLHATVQKWKCEHCTFLNDASEGNVCAVCSKTTRNPQMERQTEEILEHMEVEPRGPPQVTERLVRGPPEVFEGSDRGPPQVFDRSDRGLSRESERSVEQGPIYQLETKEAQNERLFREEQIKEQDKMEAKRQQEQEHFTMRLLLMYRKGSNFDANGGERYSLDEVAIAWNILEREGTTIIQPVDWLGKHLKNQLNLFGGDITKEFCRKYKLNPKKNHRLIPEHYIYDAWLKNDGIRDATATECVALLQEKVEEFCDKHRDIDEGRAAELLLQNGFDPDQMNWRLQKEAADKEVEAIEEWINQMWDGSKSVEDAIEEIEKSHLNNEDQREKIRRIVMAEKGLIWAAVDTFFSLRYDDERELSDCLEAVESSRGDLGRAKDFFKECSLCYEDFVMSKIIGNPCCQCHVCTECFIQNFTILAQTTACMYKFTCPACYEPKLEEVSDEEFYDYFALVGNVLKQHLDPADFDLYQQKLVIWGLMKDKNFRWCANGCSNGFLNDRVGVKKIQCTYCRKFQCFDCRKPWLDQHEKITCEEFDVWKKNNDPEFQAHGLAAHLKENGINCPKCKMRYELAKGGCMHFKCAQCMHEFCCGCNFPFLKYPNCSKFQSCRGKGLHAHHPRDCLYHLRDQDSRILQQVLQDHGVDFSRADAATNLPEGGCPVKEQQDTPNGLVDANCGKVLKDETGLCETHYKEYLVSLINQNKIDPADIFTAHELGIALGRDDVPTPAKIAGETDDVYATRLRQVLKEQIPLQVHGEGDQAAAANI